MKYNYKKAVVQTHLSSIERCQKRALGIVCMMYVLAATWNAIKPKTVTN
jgi:hypothetical protein